MTSLLISVFVNKKRHKQIRHHCLYNVSEFVFYFLCDLLVACLVLLCIVRLTYSFAKISL